MSQSGLKGFDTSLEKTHIWLKELMEDMGWEGRHHAYVALRSTPHALRDRLPADAKDAVRAVFRLLDRRVTDGEIADVQGRLPQNLQDLWPKRK